MSIDLRKINTIIQQHYKKEERLKNALRFLQENLRIKERNFFLSSLTEEERSNLDSMLNYIKEIKDYSLKIDNLHNKFIQLYKYSFDNLSSKVIYTNIPLKTSPSRITLGRRGFGLKRYWRYNSDYNLTKEEILEIFKLENDLSDFIKNESKREIYKIFKENLKDYIYIPEWRCEKPKIELDTKLIKILRNHLLGLSSYTFEDDYIKSFYIDLYYNNIKLFDSNDHFEKSIPLVVSLESVPPEDIYYLGKLSPYILNQLKVLLEKNKHIYKNNKRILKKIENNIKKYIGVSLL